MIPLKFHNSEELFFRDGVLAPEPEESLEELLARYEEASRDYSEFLDKLKKEEEPWRKTRWIGDTEPVFLEDNVRNYAHRTRVNAEWSDITLALAVDFDSPGEVTTRKAAGEKYIGYPLPASPDDYFYPGIRRSEAAAEEIARKILAHPAYRQEGVRLNIAGNGEVTLRQHGLYSALVTGFICDVFRTFQQFGGRILEVRSGGQSGVDKAGVIAAQREKIPCSILAPKGFRWRDEAGNECEGREPFIKRFQMDYVDYEAWEAVEGSDVFFCSLAENNAYNGLEMLEYEIDLKILHLNAKASIRTDPPADVQTDIRNQ